MGGLGCEGAAEDALYGALEEVSLSAAGWVEERQGKEV